MGAPMSRMLSFLHDNKGQTAVEYSLICSGIGLALVIALGAFSSSFKIVFTLLINAIK
jgi:Flp pilus assembly pilin Flp